MQTAQSVSFLFASIISGHIEKQRQAPRLLKFFYAQLSMKFFFMNTKNSILCLSEPEKQLNFLMFL